MLALDMLDRLTLGTPVQDARTGMIPILSPEPVAPEYDLAAAAIEAGTLEVSEVSEGGSVPDLEVVNSGSRPVLMLDGEELIGAKQNRILNVSVMVPAHATITVPVTCVEQGRWAYKSATFKSAGWVMDQSGRSRKMRSVAANMKRSQSRVADQGEMWDHVASMSRSLDAQSPTGAQEEIYAKYRKHLDDDVARLTPVDEQVGAIFTHEGRILGLELFDSAETFRTVAPKFVRGYTVGSMSPVTRETAVAESDAETFFRSLTALPVAESPAVGLGTEMRVETKEVIGAGLAVEERVVQLSVLPQVEDADPARRGRPGRAGA